MQNTTRSFSDEEGNTIKILSYILKKSKIDIFYMFFRGFFATDSNFEIGIHSAIYLVDHFELPK